MYSKSEIFKAAHCQAKRMECLGCAAYSARFADALKFMYANVNVNLGGYDGSLCHTLTINQREGMGL
jgi:hypothetical protein